MILQWDETALGLDLVTCCRETVERIALAAPDTSLRLGNALVCGAHWVVLRERAGLCVWAKPRRDALHGDEVEEVVPVIVKRVKRGKSC
jgi:hypothetical protein